MLLFWLSSLYVLPICADGRVAMLAFLGVLVQEFVHLPSPLFANPVATDAFFQVPAGGLWQVFLACGLCEFVSHRGKLSYDDMYEDGRIPGNFGFEYVTLPGCFGRSGAERRWSGLLRVGLRFAWRPGRAVGRHTEC